MDATASSVSDAVGARPASIEEVFTTLSKWKAYGGPSSLPRVQLTPRSAKACLREGIDPEVRGRGPAGECAVHVLRTRPSNCLCRRCCWSSYVCYG